MTPAEQLLDIGLSKA
ncbi:ADP-ribosyltransferase exoenzyme family protein, partial [Vibrio parahaemolyticus AQ3810]